MNDTKLIYDPLLCQVPLKLCHRFNPLGFPLDLHTNSELVLMAAQESWADFQPHFPSTPVLLRLGVHDGSTEAPALLSSPVFRSWQHMLAIVADADNFALCDLSQRTGFAWITRECLERRDFFRYCFLEALAYSMITAAELAPIHAACVRWRGHGFLLTGDSGAGKSALAYACLRAGFGYIGDDAAYIHRRNGEWDRRRVSGNPYRIRLRDSAANLFPELADRPVSCHPGGKATIELRTKDIPDTSLHACAFVGSIILLQREAGARPRLLAVDKQELLERWEQTNCYGTDGMRDEIRASFAGLLAAEAFRLRYSDLGDAVEYLKGMAP